MQATLITGASGGIGEAFARRLAAEGHDLLLVARSADKLQAVCDELMSAHDITAHYIALDLTAFEADKVLFDETERSGIQVDWLINNAGFGLMGDLAELPLDRQRNMIELNISALVSLTHRYLPQMRSRRSGTIVNISSSAGFQPIPFMAVYAATKSFVTSFSEAVAEENSRYGILVTAVCPGPTETNFQEVSGMGTTFALKGMQTPEQVVDAAMAAIAAGRRRVISGVGNKIVAASVNFIPTRWVTAVIGKSLRGKYQAEEEMPEQAEEK